MGEFDPVSAHEILEKLYKLGREAKPVFADPNGTEYNMLVTRLPQMITVGELIDYHSHIRYLLGEKTDTIKPLEVQVTELRDRLRNIESLLAWATQLAESVSTLQHIIQAAPPSDRIKELLKPKQ